MTTLLILALALDLTPSAMSPTPNIAASWPLKTPTPRSIRPRMRIARATPRRLQAALDEVADSVDLAYDSLAGEAHPNTKAFKRAEQQTGQLLRRMDGFRQLVDFEDRAKVDKIHERVSAAHDKLLNGIMKKK